MVVAGQLTGYRLLTELSTDELFAIARAVREADGAEVTVHVVVAELSRTQLRRVRDEAAALDNVLATSNNPFIVPLLDHGRAPDGRPFLVTGARGRSLADELAARGPLPLGEAREAVLEAATGLELLHRNGMVHQWISPAALLRQSTGRVVLDCPLLPVLAELATSMTDGTGHEPPEVLSGQDWAPAGEIYALASTLWTLLSGRPPFPGGRAERLLRMFDDAAPEPRLPDTPAGLIAVLRSALAGEPGARPVSVAAFARGVQDADGAQKNRVTRGTATVDKDTLPPAGMTVGGYDLLSPIGVGSSGTVWRARRNADGVMVAAKLLRPELVADADALIRLVREASTLHDLDLAQPNLVRIHDLVIDRGRGVAAVVMDLIEGGNLRQLMTSGQLDRVEGMRLLSEVATGLAAMHAKAIVHRDLKPENILVGEHGGRRRAMLTDFGLAKAVGHPTVTQIGQVPGTPAYLAPELITGIAPSPASDVYALGVTAYEVLAGRRPFDGATTEEVLRQHQCDHPARAAGIPERAWKFLVACLAKDPQVRPGAIEASDVLNDLALEIVLDGSETSAEDPDRTVTIAVPVSPPRTHTPQPEAPRAVDAYAMRNLAVTPTETSAHPPRAATAPPAPRRSRRRWLILAGSLVLITIVGGGIGIWLGLSRQTPTHPPETPSPSTYEVAVAVTLAPPEKGSNKATGGPVVSWDLQTDNLPGLRRYVIFRNGRYLSEVGKGTTKFADLDVPAGQSCYQVFALGVTVPPTSTPPPNQQRPNCVQSP